MGQDYFDNDVDIMRKERKKKRKRKKARRTLLSVLGILVIGVGTFFGTIKLVKPDFDFSLILPERAGQVVAFLENRKVNVDSPQQQDSTTVAPVTTTTQPDYFDYLDSSEFEFSADSKGNLVGNLLGGGSIATSPSYIYNLAKDRGIYRFIPSTEDFAISYPTKDTLTCLNLVGDYLYFINKTDGCFYSLERGTTDAKKLAEDVDFAYIYGNDAYYISGLNTMCYMDLKSGASKELYDSTGKLQFVGISLDRVFFAEDNGSKYSFLTVDKHGRDEASPFMSDTYSDEIRYMTMEDGFLYYYQRQNDGDYNLIRKKFGSDRTVTLLYNVRPNGYPIVDANKLYYATLNDGTYRMREYNMNTKTKKTMLSVSGVKETEHINIFHGGEYDFIIGQKAENGDEVYIASGMYTSSSNVMRFSQGKWEYR